MSFALNVAVSIGIPEIFRPHMQDIPVKDIQDVQAGQAAPGMPGSGLLDVLQGFFSQFQGFQL
jgi:hypothetical protein